MEWKKWSLNAVTPLLLLMMTLSGCSRVDTSIDKSASLEGYKTYSWMQPEVKTNNPVYKGDLVDRSIRESVENELAQKGMIHNDQDPDVYVKYSTFTESKQGIVGGNYMAPAYPPSYGYSSIYGPMGYVPFGYGNYYGGWYYPTVYSYTEETLMLDFIDAKTNKVVWRGSIVNDVTDTSELDKKMEKGVHSILKKYPGDDDHHMAKDHKHKVKDNNY